MPKLYEDRLTFNKLRTKFHLNAKEASIELSHSESYLKRICRKFGINRWPSRQTRGMCKHVTVLEYLISRNDTANYDKELCAKKLGCINLLYLELLITGEVNDDVSNKVFKQCAKLTAKHISDPEYHKFIKSKISWYSKYSEYSEYSGSSSLLEYQMQQQLISLYKELQPEEEANYEVDRRMTIEFIMN